MRDCDVLEFLTSPQRDLYLRVFDAAVAASNGRPIDVEWLLPAVAWYAQHHAESEAVAHLSARLAEQPSGRKTSF
jgi:hypothetical protein